MNGLQLFWGQIMIKNKHKSVLKEVCELWKYAYLKGFYQEIERVIK